MKLINHFFLVSGVVLAGIALIDCAAVSPKPQQDVKKIFLYSEIPVVQLNGQIQVYRDSSFIYYYQDYVILQFSYRYVLENEVKVITDETRYKYLLFREGDTSGKLFDSINAVKWMPANIDSVLTNRFYKSTNFDQVKTLDTLYQSLKGTGNDDLVEIYLPKKAPDDIINDTTYLYFTKQLNDIKFSFSPFFDSMKKMKLYKIRLLYNERNSEQYKIMAPERAFIFEIGAAEAGDKNAIADFVNRNAVH